MADTSKLVEIDHFREKLIELMRSFENNHNSIVPDKQGLAEFLIANDVVPVVRCKDCKEWLRNRGVVDSPNGHCFYHETHTNGHDFCSYGERKDNG